MTFAPTTLHNLEALWVMEGGVSLGIVGDAPHVLGGTSYHLGKRSLLPSAYSRVLARDIAGLSDAASAIDLGPLDNRLANLRTFSVWLVAQVRANPTAYRDVREVIYSPDGQKVLRWDNELKALRVGGTGTGQGDDSHLWHTHISFYRDSEARDKRALFAPYFAPPEEVTVSGVNYNPDSLRGTVIVAATGHAYFNPATRIYFQISPVPQTFQVHGAGVVPDKPENPGAFRNRAIWVVDVGGTDCWLPKDATSPLVPVADTTPFNQQALDDAKIDGRREEWDRIQIAATASITLPQRP